MSDEQEEDVRRAAAQQRDIEWETPQFVDPPPARPDDFVPETMEHHEPDYGSDSKEDDALEDWSPIGEYRENPSSAPPGFWDRVMHARRREEEARQSLISTGVNALLDNAADVSGIQMNHPDDTKEAKPEDLSMLIIRHLTVTQTELDYRRKMSCVAPSEKYRSSHRFAWINDIKGALQVIQDANRTLTRAHITQLETAFDDAKTQNVLVTCGRDAVTIRFYRVVQSVSEVEPEYPASKSISGYEIAEMHADASHAGVPTTQVTASSWFMDLLTFFDYHDCHISQKGVLQLKQRLDDIKGDAMYCEIRDGKPVCTVYAIYESDD